MRFAAALAPAIAVGAALRLWRLPDQVLGGDELHALRAIHELPVSKLLVSYQLSDVCLPLAAFHRALLDAGVVLSEWHFRLPSLLAGVALLGIAPLLLRRRIGERAALATGWLLAISPLLVFYSRIARSYAPLALLGFCAALAFDAWWHERRPRHAVAYVALAALAIYFHPGAGPFMAAPFLYALAAIAWQRRAWRAELLRLTALGVGLTLAAGLFLVPAAESLGRLVEFYASARALVGPGSASSPLATYLAGTPNPLVVGVFWALALRGLLHMWRAGKRFGIYSAVLVLGGIAGLALLTIAVLPRYTIVAVPFVLAWVGVGLTAPLPRASRLTRRLAAIGVAIFVVALFATGPFADRGLWRSSFMHHNDFVHFTRERTPRTDSTLPPLYRALVGEGPLVEYPWLGAWEVSRTPLVYQQLHGRRVLVAGRIPWLNDPRLKLRNFVWPTAEALLASVARHLVVHLAMDAEERALRPHPPNRASPSASNLRGASAFADRLGRRWGPPHYVGETLVAWDLERLREAGPPSRGSR